MRALPLALALAVLPCLAAAHGDPHHDRIRAAKVVVVSGSADHMDRVLKKAGVGYVVVAPDELPQLPLHSGQVLMVNCRGEMSEAARERVRRFVRAGGFLYTTDHAVAELVQKIFPNTIAHDGRTSREEVFPMQVRGEASARGLLEHLDQKSGARWQLAGGGYLFQVLDPHKVEVLMESAEVARKYGTGVLGVRFRYEDGAVIHVTGHFYSQPGQTPEAAVAGRAFEQLSDNVVAEKAVDQERLDRLYDKTPRREVQLRAAPKPDAPSVPAGSVTSQSMGSGAKVRVLEKSGGYVKVRDAEGNEGWADADAF